MLELFKGQIPLETLKYGMSYKEALQLRDARIKRLKKEREEMEKERQAEAARQKREQARQSILKK